MRAVVQRVLEASVEVDGRIAGQIGPGLLILLGVRNGDTVREVQWVAGKCLDLRIFEDQGGKMNGSVRDVAGGVLVISQFTLYGDCRKGRRPSFIDAAPPAVSEPLYAAFVKCIAASGLRTAQGVFGAPMKVRLLNDGPVTVIVGKDAQTHE
jgi:D-tyrosyl-tRNA(Tyr) deacylase